MVDAEVSGVMFTCNPVSGDPSMVAINASWGLGLAVVGGEVTPDDYLVSKITGEVVRGTIAEKDSRVRARRGGHGAVDASRCPRSCARSRASTTPALAALVEVGRRVERLLRLATRTSSGRSRRGGELLHPPVATRDRPAAARADATAGLGDRPCDGRVRRRRERR